MYSASDRQIGALPVAAIGGAISAGASVIKSIFGGGDDPQKEANRQASIANAYQAALQGDVKALEMLKWRSGDFGKSGSLDLRPYADKGTVEGFATRTARDAARAAYKDVLARRTATGAAGGTSGASALGQASLGPMIAIALAGAAAIALTSGRRR